MAENIRTLLALKKVELQRPPWLFRNVKQQNLISDGHITALKQESSTKLIEMNKNPSTLIKLIGVKKRRSVRRKV